jgi:hypothetical protein
MPYGAQIGTSVCPSEEVEGVGKKKKDGTEARQKERMNVITISYV